MLGSYAEVVRPLTDCVLGCSSNDGVRRGSLLDSRPDWGRYTDGTVVAIKDLYAPALLSRFGTQSRWNTLSVKPLPYVRHSTKLGRGLDVTRKQNMNKKSRQGLLKFMMFRLIMTEGHENDK